MALPEGECPVMWWVRLGRLVESWVGFWGRVVDMVVGLGFGAVRVVVWCNP